MGGKVEDVKLAKQIMNVLRDNLPEPFKIETRITGLDVDAEQTFTILALPEGGFRAIRKVFDTFRADVLVIEEVFKSETFDTPERKWGPIWVDIGRTP